MHDPFMYCSCVHDPRFRMGPTVPATPLSGTQLTLMECKLLSQPLPEDAVTLNMTKCNTVPTNRSDITGNIVTEMVTWATSAVVGELELIT